jgi:DNA-binding MarR family transcriptional regulator
MMRSRPHAVKDRSAGGGERRPTRTPAGDALSVLVVQVFRLHGLLTAAGDALARPAGQTSARWQVLAAVEKAPRPVAGIARALALTRQSVQRVADLLVEEGLAAYGDNPEHLRAKLVRLTPRGRAALTTIQDAQRAWADSLAAAIGEPDLRRTSAVLERLLRALSVLDEEQPLQVPKR